MTATLTFLGSGDSQGVPRWWCDCRVCDAARRDGTNARTRPSALLDSDGSRALIDAAPDFREQANRAGVRALDAVLVTHAHNDHILGLGDVMDYVSRTGAALEVLAPEGVLPELQDRFSYLFRGRLRDRFRAMPAGGIERFGWRITPFEVPHGFNGVAHALRFDRPDAMFAWAYAPDAIGIPDDLARERLTGLDLLVLGASFWHEDAPLETRSVYDVGEAVDLARRVRPRATVLTHLGHDVDAARAAELPPGVRLARDGLRVNLERKRGES